MPSEKVRARRKSRQKAKKPLMRVHNKKLAKCGVMRFSRARMYQKRLVFRRLSTEPPKRVEKPKVEQYIVKKVGGEKNGGERKILKKKPPKYYSVVPKRRERKLGAKKLFKNHPRKLKPSLTPGTIVIVLSGRHRGKRCVFLKQLGSGLILITGPLKLNGCPLRRVHQKMVIATKTKLDLGDFKVDRHLNDKYFRRIKEKKKKRKTDSDIFATKKAKYEVSEKRKKDQIVVDKVIMQAIKKRDDKRLIYGYLGSKWGLRRGDYPHEMVF